VGKTKTAKEEMDGKTKSYKKGYNKLPLGQLPTHLRLLPTHFWEGPLGRAGGWVIGRESCSLHVQYTC